MVWGVGTGPQNTGSWCGGRYWITEHWVVVWGYRYWTTEHWVVVWGKALNYRTLGRGVGVGTGPQNTGSWCGGRYWTTEHWVMVWGVGTGPQNTGSWCGGRYWITEHWVVVWGYRYWTTEHWVVVWGKALNYRTLGRGVGVGTGLQNTVSWCGGRH